MESVIGNVIQHLKKEKPYVPTLELNIRYCMMYFLSVIYPIYCHILTELQ